MDPMVFTPVQWVVGYTVLGIVAGVSTLSYLMRKWMVRNSDRLTREFIAASQERSEQVAALTTDTARDMRQVMDIMAREYIHQKREAAKEQPQ